MKRKILSVFLCSLMLAGGICGCGHDDDSNINSDSSSQVVHVDGTFDIEEVRKNINIKGYHFEVPMKLEDLEKGLKYEFVGEEFDDGLYNQGIVRGNCYKRNKKHIFNNYINNKYHSLYFYQKRKEMHHPLELFKYCPKLNFS